MSQREPYLSVSARIAAKIWCCLSTSTVTHVHHNVMGENPEKPATSEAGITTLEAAKLRPSAVIGGNISGEVEEEISTEVQIAPD